MSRSRSPPPPRGSRLHELHHPVEGGVGGGGDADLFAEADDGTAEGLDLRRFFRPDVLEGRGLVPRRRRQQPLVEDGPVLIRRRPVGPVSRRLHHCEDLSDEGLHDLPGGGDLGQVAVGDAEDRPQGVQGAVVEHLRPEVISDVRDDLGGDPALCDRLRKRRHRREVRGEEAPEVDRVGVDGHLDDVLLGP